MVLKTGVDQLDGHVPIRFYWQDSAPMIDWCWMGTERLTAPFFDQSIEKQLRLPFSLLFRPQTPIETLRELQEARPGIKPSGFIFHMSRCGSTLITQMLATLSHTVVAAEPNIVSSILRAHYYARGLSDEQRSEWLRWVISALGQKRNAQERNFVIKLDSWHALEWPLFQRAFPDVPSIFVYREPIEVMASHFKSQASYLMPGMLDPALIGLDVQALRDVAPEEYFARVIGKICEAALEHRRREQDLLVNYTQLPQVVESSLLDFFQIKCTTDELEGLRQASERNAKQPSLKFEDDTATKRLAATDEMRLMAETWVKPCYERLEAERLAQLDDLRAGAVNSD